MSIGKSTGLLLQKLPVIRYRRVLPIANNIQRTGKGTSGIPSGTSLFPVLTPHSLSTLGRPSRASCAPSSNPPHQEDSVIKDWNKRRQKPKR
jgi:hypothetical protein